MGRGIVDYASPIADHPLNKGLVSWWLPLNNNKGGLRLFDIAGPNDGTLKNGVNWISNSNVFEGSGLSFDGSNDYVDCGNVSTFNGATKLTVASWVKITTAADYSGVFGKMTTGNVGAFMSSGGLGSGNNLGMFVGARVGANSEDGFSSGSNFSAGTWNHWVYRFDGDASGNSGKLRAFLNGNELSLTYRGIIPSTISSNSQILDFGSGNLGVLTALNGSIGCVHLYSRALSTFEIGSLYYELLGGFTQTLNRFNRRSYAGFIPPVIIPQPRIIRSYGSLVRTGGSIVKGL